MNNFFLLNEAIEIADFEKFKIGMGKLITIEKDKEDCFMRHESIWNLKIMELLYNNYGQKEQVISQFIEQLTSSELYFTSHEEFDKNYPDDFNAFLGVDFTNTKILEERQIIDIESFNSFKGNNLWNISPQNIWERKDKLFPHIVLCDKVKEQCFKIGTSSYFNQIIDKLKILDQIASNWKDGDFSYKESNNNYAIKMSPESNSTMNNYGSERRFKLPNGSIKTFELHIKTGDLRFHIYPDNESKKIYVGYIGKHLKTFTDK